MYKKLKVMFLSLLLVFATSQSALASSVQSVLPNVPAEMFVTLTADGSTGGGSFSVTVPMSLPIHVDAQGVVTPATDAKIVNNSAVAVVVSYVSLEAVPMSGWSIVSYGTDFASLPVDTSKIGFVINGDTSNDGGGLSFNTLNWQDIPSGTFMPLVYSAKLPVQSVAITGEAIAKVTFIVNPVN